MYNYENLWETGMARKSNDLDKKMLRAGALLLRKGGLSTFSVRDVTKKANVNLGMFNYHFGNKDNFIKRLLDEAYTPFILDLESHRSQDNGLEEILFRMACFSRDHSESLLHLLADSLSHEKNVVHFLKSNFTQHLAILQDAITAYFEVNNYPSGAKDHAFRFLIAAVGLPNVMSSLRVKFMPSKTTQLDNDEALRRRVRAALAGLSILCSTTQKSPP